MRTSPIVLVLSAGLLFAAGCSADPALETKYELTGDSGATADITRTIPQDPNSDTQTTTAKFPGISLPWNQTAVLDKGTTTLEATPSKGALTCRIVVAGKEVAKVTGAPGAKVTCTGKVAE